MRTPHRPRAAWAAALLTASGCNLVFGLDPPGGGGDGAAVDGPGDGAGGDGPDRDGDGVADGLDNCPDVYNPRQSDDDGDGTGDLCDGCPSLALTGGVNVDGDGVDDLCDASTTTRECIVWFDGFDADSRARYQVPVASSGQSYGTWVPDDTTGGLIQDDAAAADALILTTAGYTRPWVRVRARVLTLLPPTGDAGAPVDAYTVGVWPRALHDPPAVLPDGCLVEITQPVGNGSASVHLGWVAAGQATFPSTAPHGLALTAGRDVVIDASEGAGILSGRTELDGDIVGLSGPVTCSLGLSQVGLRTRHARVRFDSLMITDADPFNCPPTGACTCPPPPEP